VVFLAWVRPLHFGLMNASAVPRCIFGFFLGAALCAALEPAKTTSGRSASSAEAALQFGSVTAAVAVLCVLGLSEWDLLMPILFAVVIATFVIWPQTWLTQAAMSQPLLWLGKHSYSIYMVHWFILVLISSVLRSLLHVPMVEDRFAMKSAAGLSVTVLSVTIILLVAAHTYRLIEEPGRILGRHLIKNRAGVQSMRDVAGDHPTSAPE
jgi:peptidoglycan/LPS O-acetylase OafA/YrhL